MVLGCTDKVTEIIFDFYHPLYHMENRYFAFHRKRIEMVQFYVCLELFFFICYFEIPFLKFQLQQEERRDKGMLTILQIIQFSQINKL